MRTFVLILLFAALPLASGSFQPEVEAPYWKSVTGLDLAAVLARINNEKCNRDARYFESCRQALLTAMDLSENADQETRAFLKAKVFGTKPSINFEIEFGILDKQPEGAIPKQMIFGKALSAHLRVFDRYAQLMPAAYAGMLLDGESHTFYGLGLEVSASREGLRIFRVHARSAAARAALRVHDRILSVNGVTASNEFEAEQMAAMLNGNAGETMRLQIQRNSRGLEPMDLVIAPITVPESFESEFKLEDKRVLYHRVMSFGADTCWNLQKRLWEASTPGQKLDGLILDLRHNPGGLVEEGRCVAQLFTGDKQVFTRKPLQNYISLEYLADEKISVLDTQSLFAWRKTFADIPVIVLIDARSKSMSEMVAAALQDLHPKAWIVGARSFGKGSTQVMHRMRHIPTLRLLMTVSNYVRPNGDLVQDVGVTPNFEVPFRKHANAQERTFLREGARDPDWKDPRQVEVNKINGCIAAKSTVPNGEALFRARFGFVDYQVAQGLDILSCVGAQHNTSMASR